jgi:hypothetical protein
MYSTIHAQDQAYTYDPVGNITQMVDDSAICTGKIATYTYDDLYRLTQAAIHATAPMQVSYTQTFTYDPIGNLLTSSTASGTYAYTGNQGTNYANPHAVTSIGSTAYTYDHNGNQLTKGSTLANTWNYNNLLTQSRTTTATTHTLMTRQDRG